MSASGYTRGTLVQAHEYHSGHSAVTCVSLELNLLFTFSSVFHPDKQRVGQLCETLNGAGENGVKISSTSQSNGAIILGQSHTKWVRVGKPASTYGSLGSARFPVTAS